MPAKRSHPYAWLGSLLLIVVSASPAAQPKAKIAYEECWKINITSARTGPIVIRSNTPGATGEFDVQLYTHPFRWVDPAEPAAVNETFAFCRDPDSKRKGAFFLNGAELPTMAITAFGSEWPMSHYGSWKAKGEADGMVQVGINTETGAARVILVRGKAMKRTAMLGTGQATRLAP
ncbi:MAG TPA: hypothetical protein VF471_08370 [Pseudoxanthomonas sp.]